MTARSILAAKAEALAARADLTASITELKARAAPRRLARTALAEVRERGEDLADRGTHFAKRRPGAVAGVTIAAGLLVLRRPLGRALRRLFSRKPAPAPSPRYAALTPEEEILP